MVLMISMFLLTFILLIGFFVLSINFFVGDFQNLYSDYMQSQNIVIENININKETLFYLNADGIGNDDYNCFDLSGDYQDNDCEFRSIIGFLPPNVYIDLGVYENVYGSGLYFQFSGDVGNGFDIVVSIIDYNSTIREKFYESGYLLRQFDGNEIGIKIKNKSDQRNQFMVTLSGSNGLFNINNNNQNWNISHYYNYYFASKKLMGKDINLSLTGSIGIIDILNQRRIGSLSGDVSSIHLNASSNNHLAGIVVESVDNINPGEWIYIQTGFDAVLCSGRLNGYYWNPDVNNTLWPLDPDTLSYWQGTGDYYDQVTISGGLYTYCSGTYDHLNTIYGTISWYYNGSEQLSLESGKQYDYATNLVSSTNSLTESLQFYNYAGHDIPIGIIYDSNNGLGFVGGEMSTGSVLDNLITRTNNFNEILDYISSVDNDKIHFTNDIGIGTFADRFNP